MILKYKTYLFPILNFPICKTNPELQNPQRATRNYPPSAFFSSGTVAITLCILIARMAILKER